ncbi:MAG: excinuclease ABC subunit UvrC, partial [Alphaproteobacteria bacterium]|nr:excinuclease ABC subunit UvrC [Alphaproteobacteria bacterium]
IGDADVIGLHRAGDRTCIQVFFFRSGQNFGNKSYFPSHAPDCETEEILSAFIGQLYQTHKPPKQVLISQPVEHTALLEEALALGAGHKVQLSVPTRGDKLTVMGQVVANAKYALEHHIAQRSTQRDLLEGVAKLFALEKTPERIEVYDNSHLLGKHALGGMIVAGAEGFIKNQYRQFGIKEGADARAMLTGGDDYAMLRETLSRRFSRLLKDDPDRQQEGIWPDLILVDGGAAHLKIVEEVFADLGITDVPYVCIAKGVDRNAGREWFHRTGISPFQLPPHDPVLHYLQRLRDEAHRFAIGSHRNKRSKAIVKSELDNAPGIGATRKKAILHHFGSAKAASTASLSELESVPGLNKKTALALYNYFHS